MVKHPFDDFIDFLNNKHGEEVWVTVYKSDKIGSNNFDGAMYCALVDQENTADAMSRNGWDLTIGSGGPGFCTYYEEGEEITEYYANSDEGFLRPILVRDFHGRKDDYIEIIEEFRLFHNLYHDPKSNTYMSFDDVGDEIEVIKIMENEVRIRRHFLRSFMAAKQMNLLLYFELTRHFKYQTTLTENEASESLKYTIYSGKSYNENYTSFSRILGKKLIRCAPIDKCGIWPFNKEKVYQEFMVAGDSDEPYNFTCNPDLLANYFGANPDAPHYLTPIFFRKDVMQKYYSASDYDITDGHLRRAGAWSLRFDNNAPDHVSVFLGDLGRDLPEKEQIYWKSFNISPEGRKISKANFERSFLGNFHDSESPEHIFKYKFRRLQDKWRKEHDFELFLPLAEKDEHFFSSLRSMLTNEQSEFDSQVLALTKITIDSINVKSLRKYLEIIDTDVKSIAIMEMLLDKLKSPETAKFISLLRGIQSVRSTGVAHRKGTDYAKAIARLNIDDADYASEFDLLLMGMNELFDEIIRLNDTSTNS